MQLRHEVPVITDGVYKLLDADNEKVYTYLRLRKNEDETLLVICNFTKETIDYPVGDFVEATQEHCSSPIMTMHRSSMRMLSN